MTSKKGDEGDNSLGRILSTGSRILMSRHIPRSEDNVDVAGVLFFL